MNADESFERIFGTSLAAIRGRELSQLVSPKDRRGLRSLDKAVTSGGEDARIDLILTLRVGDSDFLTRARAHRDEQGWWLWLENVLERSNDLVQVLQVGAARWSAVHARSDEGIAILDADDRLLELNNRFFELAAFESSRGVRYNEEALEGQNVFDLLGHERHRELREAAKKGRTRKKLRFEAVIPHHDLFLDVKISPIHLPVKGYVGSCLTLRDVTHQELLEQLTRELQQKNADITAMLGNLRQGICTIMPGSVIHSEYSRHLEAMLGTDQIANQPVAELVFAGADLGADTLHQVCSVIDLCLSCDMFTFDLNEHLLVREFERVAHGERRVFEADWVPLVGTSGMVERLMLTLRDVTALRDLQAETQAQREELMVVGQLICTTPGDYDVTMANAERNLAEAARVIEEPGGTDPSQSAARLAVLFRLMHTIKGDARSHGWTAVADAAHQAEDTYACMRKQTLAWEAERLAAELATVRDVLARYRHTWEVSLARSSAPSGLLAVSPKWVDEMLDLVSAPDARSTSSARARLLSLGYPTLETICGPPFQAMAACAENRQKSAPLLIVDDGGVRASAEAATLLRQMLDHLMMNALDHSIETDAIRQAHGKAVPASIRIDVEVSATAVAVSFCDDGSGLNQQRLRESRPDASDAQLLEMIFESGTTTFEAATMTSGRGVGLDALRQLAAAHGGDIRAEYREAAAHGDDRPIAFVVTLPRHLFKTG